MPVVPCADLNQLFADVPTALGCVPAAHQIGEVGVDASTLLAGPVCRELLDVFLEPTQQLGTVVPRVDSAQKLTSSLRHVTETGCEILEVHVRQVYLGYVECVRHDYFPLSVKVLPTVGI